MKKILIVVLLLFGLSGCIDDNVIIPPTTEIKDVLKIQNPIGIKLETPFVTNEVAMNVKVDVEQIVTIKIFDISNKVISKETMDVKAGDNVLKIYTSTLPSSSYRIGLYNSNHSAIFKDRLDQKGIIVSIFSFDGICFKCELKSVKSLSYDAKPN